MASARGGICFSALRKDPSPAEEQQIPGCARDDKNNCRRNHAIVITTTASAQEGSAPLPGRVLFLRTNSRSLAAPVMTRTIAVATTQLSSRRWLQPEEGSAFPLSGRILPLRTNCRSLAAPVMTKIGRAADVTAQAGQVSAIALQNLEHLHGRQRSSGRQRNFRFLRFNEAVHAVKRNSRQGRPQFEAREAFSGSGVL
jgi:hypothetical protein